jgi:mono/diheme cytochrome c family protein
MYRGILQHKHYVTTFLRKQIIDRKLDKHIGLGRIYRVVHTGRKPQAAPKMSEQGYEQLIGHLESGNGWRRDTAQRLLVERNEKAALPILRETATASEYHLARQHALWALEGLDGLDAPTIAQALGDKHPRVRIAALRVTESFTAKLGSREADTEARVALLPALTEVAQDENADVRQQMALSLPGIKVPGSEPLLRTFVVKHAENSVVRDGLISGLAGRELEFLQRVAANENWVTNGNLRNIVQALAGCVARQRNAARLEQLLKLAQSLPSAAQINLLDGINKAAFPKGRGLKPVAFQSQPQSMASMAESDDQKVKERVARLSKFIVWGELAKPPVPPRALTAAELKQFDLGKILYTATCGACHQANGLGEEGKAPPLLDSPFLVGPADRAIGIVLHGVTGPITVHGRQYNMSMPALQGFQSEQIAAILTYTRREWDHRADPVTPEQVDRLKAAEKKREAPWTEAELLKLK